MAPRIPAIRPKIYDFSDAGSFGGAFYVFDYGVYSRGAVLLTHLRLEAAPQRALPIGQVGRRRHQRTNEGIRVELALVRRSGNNNPRNSGRFLGNVVS